MFKLKIVGSKKAKAVIVALTAGVFVAVPFFGLGSHHDDLYVNAKASGMQDGSKNHPYKKIAWAIDKADSNTEIHVSKGEYVENITLKKGIKLYGHDKDDTIIKAKKDKWSTVYMEDNSEIDGFTITRGDRGIWVGKHAKAKIINCVVKYNDGDGIGIEGYDTSKSDLVYIGKSEIRNNGRAGIYVTGPRKISFMDNGIRENDGDGMDIVGGVSAYIASNSVKNNGGSGIVATIDGSDIWTKSNSIRRNKREGMEVTSFGAAGHINVAKAKFVDNGRYAVTRLQRGGNLSSTAWNQQLTFENNNYFAGNALGNISRIFWLR